ncbi:MAG: hypothetical protein Tsb0020_38800 [Haliangiales bacterium]
MKTKNINFGIATVLLATSLSVGCAVDGVDGDSHELNGELAPAGQIEPLATVDADGMHFASEEIARQWSQAAPGVWSHSDGTRLIFGAEGHRWAADELEAELDALYAADASMDVVAAKEAALDQRLAALDKASGEEIRTEVSCNVAMYTDISSPITGFVGGAALAQISCTNGTVAFTVDSMVCTSTGCSSNSQTAVPDSIPRIWGVARSGTGNCFSDVFISLPAGFGQAANHTCG